MIHLVVLKGQVGAEIELHQDDSLQEHLANSGNAKYKNIFIGYKEDVVCSDHTTVLYLDIPADMEGGEFYIKENSKIREYKPHTNSMIRFTGDTWHGARPVISASTPRVVLVCEQYKLSKRTMRVLRAYDSPLILKG